MIITPQVNVAPPDDEYYMKNGLQDVRLGKLKCGVLYGDAALMEETGVSEVSHTTTGIASKETAVLVIRGSTYRGSKAILTTQFIVQVHVLHV